MRIPKKLRIGNITYKVEKKKLDKNFGIHKVSHKETTIIIDKKLKEDLAENTLYHEITHAILYNIGHPDFNNELVVQTIANELQKLFNIKEEHYE